MRAEVSKSSKRESNHKEGLRKEDGKAAAGEGWQNSNVLKTGSYAIFWLRMPYFL